MSWVESIDIKQHLTEDESPEAISEACRGILRELKKLRSIVPPRRITDAFKAQSVLGNLRKANKALNDLYDWADERRVWLGL